MEPKQLLDECDYRPGIIDASISNARAVPQAKSQAYVSNLVKTGCKSADK
jgi:hypothetical protein